MSQSDSNYYRPPDYDQVLSDVEEEETNRKMRLWGNMSTIVNKLLAPFNAHITSWLFSGATRSGKSVAMWAVVWLYRQLGFKIVSFDLPSLEGTNVCESGFFTLPMDKVPDLRGSDGSVLKWKNHPLLPMVNKVYGKPVKLERFKIFRPFILAEHDQPVGLGVNSMDEKIPDCVTPFTIGLSTLMMADWLSLIGEPSIHAYSLLQQALAGINEETSIQSVMTAVADLSQQLGITIMPDMPLPEATKKIRLGEIRGVDKRSVPMLFTNLRELMNAGLILPTKIDGDAVETNIDLKQAIKDNDWITFNFNPTAPPHLVYSIMRYVIHNMLRLKGEKIVFVIDELSHFAPRQLPEKKEYYTGPMRYLLQILSIQFAKAGKVLFAATQLPDKIDETVLNSCRSRVYFPSGTADMEHRVLETRVQNAKDLVANLRLIADETKHFSIAVPPGSKGYAIRGDNIPPFRTHTTNEGDFDEVYQQVMGNGHMVSVRRTCDYVRSIIARCQNREALAQEGKLSKKVQTEKFSASLRAASRRFLLLAPSEIKGSPRKYDVTRKDALVELMKDAFGRSACVSNIRDLVQMDMISVDTSIPRKTRLIVNVDKLEKLVERMGPETQPDMEEVDNVPNLDIVTPKDVPLGYPASMFPLEQQQVTPTGVAAQLPQDQKPPSMDFIAIETADMDPDELLETQSGAAQELSRKPGVLLVPEQTSTKSPESEPIPRWLRVLAPEILRVLPAEGEGVSPREVTDRLKANEGHITKALGLLAKASMIEKLVTGRRVRYRLSRKPSVLLDAESAVENESVSASPAE